MISAGTLSFALVVGLVPSTTPAQGAVSLLLRVRAPDSIPLSGAAVRADTIRARTDERGEVRLLLAPGPHRVVVTRLGYAPDSLDLVLRTGMDTSVTVVLREQETFLTGVVVNATRSERRIEDDPVRVEVLDAEEVVEKLLMTPGDITMMLNETSGLRVQVTSPSLGGATVRVQGAAWPVHPGAVGRIAVVRRPDRGTRIAPDPTHGPGGRRGHQGRRVRVVRRHRAGRRCEPAVSAAGRGPDPRPAAQPDLAGRDRWSALRRGRAGRGW